MKTTSTQHGTAPPEQQSTHRSLVTLGREPASAPYVMSTAVAWRVFQRDVQEAKDLSLAELLQEGSALGKHTNVAHVGRL